MTAAYTLNGSPTKEAKMKKIILAVLLLLPVCALGATPTATITATANMTLTATPTPAMAVIVKYCNPNKSNNMVRVNMPNVVNDYCSSYTVTWLDANGNTVTNFKADKNKITCAVAFFVLKSYTLVNTQTKKNIFYNYCANNNIEIVQDFFYGYPQ